MSTPTTIRIFTRSCGGDTYTGMVTTAFNQREQKLISYFQVYKWHGDNPTGPGVLEASHPWGTEQGAVSHWNRWVKRGETS